MWNMEETRYRMHLYWYKQKIQQCEILAYTGSIETLKSIPHSIPNSVKSTVGPTPCSGQLPSQDNGEMGQLSTTKQDAA